MTTRYEAWALAQHSLMRAERELFLQAAAHECGAGEPPSIELIHELARLRAEAHDGLMAFLRECDAMRAKIRHDRGSIDFALRMTKRRAQRVAGAALVPADIR